MPRSTRTTSSLAALRSSTARWTCPPQNGNRVGLSIGANGKIYGTFDQIRVSAGILPVDKFMRHVKADTGMLLILK